MHWKPDPNDSVALLSALLLNAALYFLSRRFSPQFLRPYVPLFRVHSVVDCACEFLFFSIGPVGFFSIGIHFQRVYPFNFGLYYFFRGWWRAGSPAVMMQQMIFYISLVAYLPIVMVSVDFVFRWILVCHRYQMTNRQLIVYALCATVYSILFGYPSYVAVIRTDPHHFSAAELNTVKAVMELESLPPLGKVTASGPLPIMVFCMYNMVLLVEALFIRRIARQIAAAAAAQIEQGPKPVAAQTENRLLNRILILQASIPLISWIPTLCLVGAAILGFDCRMLGSVLTPSLMWMPTLRPLALIFAVPHYRRPIFRLFQSKTTVTRFSANC